MRKLCLIWIFAILTLINIVYGTALLPIDESGYITYCYESTANTSGRDCWNAVDNIADGVDWSGVTQYNEPTLPLYNCFLFNDTYTLYNLTVMQHGINVNYVLKDYSINISSDTTNCIDGAWSEVASDQFADTTLLAAKSHTGFSNEIKALRLVYNSKHGDHVGISELYIYGNASEIVTNFTITAEDLTEASVITNFTIQIDGQTYSTTTGSIETHLPLNSTNLFNINISTSNYINRSLSLNISSNYNVRLYGLRAYASDYIGNSITGFDVIEDTNSYTITPGNNLMPVTNGTYTFIFYNSSFAMSNISTTIEIDYTNGSLSTHNITFTDIYTRNSLNITIKYEETGAIINDRNVTITFSHTLGEWENLTSTGYFFIDYLIDTEYSILFSAPEYGSRTYTITVANYSHQSITAYLAANTSETLFTITDIDTSSILEGVLCSMYRFIDGDWNPVESKYSDITGKVEFEYIEDVNYKFYLSKDNYEDYIFYLNPILFSEYDIKMERSALAIAENERIALRFYPTFFYEGVITNFTFLIQNPNGELIAYGFNLDYPGGSNSSYGTNAIGEQLTVSLNISGAEFGDVLRLDYHYITSIAGNKTYTYFFPITLNSTIGTHYQSDTYGLGIFERVLVITIIVIIVVGIASLIGRPIEGAAIGLIIFGYFTYNNFIPVWAILPSMFVGIVYLSMKGG